MCEELLYERQRIQRALEEFWQSMQNLELEIARHRLDYLRKLVEDNITEANVRALEIAESCYRMVVASS